METLTESVCTLVDLNDDILFHLFQFILSDKDAISSFRLINKHYYAFCSSDSICKLILIEHYGCDHKEPFETYHTLLHRALNSKNIYHLCQNGSHKKLSNQRHKFIHLNTQDIEMCYNLTILNQHIETFKIIFETTPESLTIKSLTIALASHSYEILNFLLDEKFQLGATEWLITPDEIFNKYVTIVGEFDKINFVFSETLKKMGRIEILISKIKWTDSLIVTFFNWRNRISNEEIVLIIKYLPNDLLIKHLSKLLQVLAFKNMENEFVYFFDLFLKDLEILKDGYLNDCLCDMILTTSSQIIIRAILVFKELKFETQFILNLGQICSVLNHMNNELWEMVISKTSIQGGIISKLLENNFDFVIIKPWLANVDHLKYYLLGTNFPKICDSKMMSIVKLIMKTMKKIPDVKQRTRLIKRLLQPLLFFSKQLLYSFEVYQQIFIKMGKLIPVKDIDEILNKQSFVNPTISLQLFSTRHWNSLDEFAKSFTMKNYNIFILKYCSEENISPIQLYQRMTLNQQKLFVLLHLIKKIHQHPKSKIKISGVNASVNLKSFGEVWNFCQNNANLITISFLKKLDHLTIENLFDLIKSTDSLA